VRRWEKRRKHLGVKLKEAGEVLRKMCGCGCERQTKIRNQGRETVKKQLRKLKQGVNGPNMPPVKIRSTHIRKQSGRAKRAGRKSGKGKGFGVGKTTAWLSGRTGKRNSTRREK